MGFIKGNVIPSLISVLAQSRQRQISQIWTGLVFCRHGYKYYSIIGFIETTILSHF